VNDTKRIALALLGLLAATTVTGVGMSAWHGANTGNGGAQIHAGPAEFEPAFCRGPATTACFSMPARGSMDW
jgi:hypothetical protein